MQRALETLQSNLENDTDIAAAELDLMERTTLASAFKYQAVNDQLQPTLAASLELSEVKRATTEAFGALDELESYTGYVERLIEELDRWVCELEVKATRLSASAVR